MFKLVKTAMLAAIAIGSFAIAQELRHGETRTNDDGALEAWDSDAAEWVDPVTFWHRYAERKGGLTWGRRNDYPPYGEVNEFDTMIVDVDSGPCLMEFFHKRWRRANDVRRWDSAFNEYGGCPNVFD